MIFFHLILHPTVPDFDIIIFLFIISSELLIKILLAHSEPVSAPSQLFLGMSCHIMLDLLQKTATHVRTTFLSNYNCF